MAYDIPSHRLEDQQPPPLPIPRQLTGEDIDRSIIDLVIKLEDKGNKSDTIDVKVEFEEDEEKKWKELLQKTTQKQAEGPQTEREQVYTFFELVQDPNPPPNVPVEPLQLPPDQQDDGLPELFRDVMGIRQEVLVRERGGRLEDIAADLQDDSVSLHWVLYFKDWVDSKNIKVEGIKDRYEKIWVQIPIGTIKVRPVIGTAGPASGNGPPEHEKTTPPFVGVRTTTNFLQVLDPMVLPQYRGKYWAEYILFKAVTKAFEGHLPTEFFHDIFSRVIPVTEGALHEAQQPADIAAVRSQWKDQIVRAMPCALDWSGVMCVNVHIVQRAGKLEAWWNEAGFVKDPQVEAWDCGCCPGGRRVAMVRYWGTLKALKAGDLSMMDLAAFSPAQREAFNITDAMLCGTEAPKLLIRAADGPSRLGRKRKFEES